MGVLKFKNRFLKGILTDLHHMDYNSHEFSDIASLLIDMTGWFYDIANHVYVTGESLDGRHLDMRTKDLEAYRLKTEEMLRFEFMSKLKEMLTKNIVEKFNPREILIIAMDGKAFRAKQKQQMARRFEGGESDVSFNASEQFTFGSDYINDITITIRTWILEQQSMNNLPPIIYFSDCSEEGEAEHKMFRIFDLAIVEHGRMFEKNFPNVYNEKKDKIKERLFSMKHVVFGKDSDLFFLSLIRTKYPFMWFGNSSDVFRNQVPSDFNSMINIPLIRGFIVSKMITSEEPSPKEILQVLRDFVLLSFLIGDDFVPGSFCFDLHIGMALSKMMTSYKELNLPLTKQKGSDLKIITDNFAEFLGLISSIEESFFKAKKNIMEIQHYIRDNKGSKKIESKKQILEDVKTFIGITNSAEILLDSPLLECETFEDFESNWKINVCCPNYRNLKSKNKKLLNGLAMWNEEFKTACHQYLTGLQWNLSYYFGFVDLNDWVYNWSYGPTTGQLANYIKDNNVTFLTDYIDSDRVDISNTAVLFSIFNIHSSKTYLQSRISNTKSRLNQNINVEKILKCSKLVEAYHPKTFVRRLEGTFVSVKYEYLKKKSKKSNKRDTTNHSENRDTTKHIDTTNNSKKRDIEDIIELLHGDFTNTNKKLNVFGQTVLLPFMSLEMQTSIKEISKVESSIKSGTKKYGTHEHLELDNITKSRCYECFFNRKVEFGVTTVTEINEENEPDEKDDNYRKNKSFSGKKGNSRDSSGNNRNSRNSTGSYKGSKADNKNTKKRILGRGKFIQDDDLI